MMSSSVVGFLGTADLMVKLSVSENPRWRLAAILKISNGHISSTVHPINFMFGSGVGFRSRRIERRHFRFDQTPGRHLFKKSSWHNSGST